MKTNLLRVAVLAVSTLASAGSFADGIHGQAPQASPAVASKTIDAVKTTPMDSTYVTQVNAGDNNYPSVAVAQVAKAKTRNQIRAETLGTAYLDYDRYLFSR